MQEAVLSCKSEVWLISRQIVPLLAAVSEALKTDAFGRGMGALRVHDDSSSTRWL